MVHAKHFSKPSDWLPVLLVALWSGWMVSGLTAFPAAYMDEVEYANHAWNYIHTGHIQYSLYDHLYPEQLYAFRHAWPPVIRPFYVWLLSACIRCAGLSLFWMRGLSLLGGILTLALGIIFSKKIFQNAAAPLAALTLTALHPYFSMTAGFVRPEIFLALQTLATLACFVIGIESARSPLWLAGAGVLAGTSMGVHTNGVALMTAATCLWIPLALQKKIRLNKLLAYLVGLTLGFCWFVRSADWDSFLPAMNFLFFSQFNKIPIMNNLNPVSILSGEMSRYTGGWVFDGARWPHLFKMTQAVFGTLFLSALIIQFRSAKRSPGSNSGLVYWFTVFLLVGYALLIGYKAPSYAVVLIPLASIVICLAGETLWTVGSKKIRPQRIAAILLIPLFIFTAGSAIFLTGERSQKPAFEDLKISLRNVVPANTSVAGPMTFWLALNDHPYFDLGALVWSKLLTGNRDPVQSLLNVKPDIVILDEPMAKRLYAKHSDVVPWPHKLLAIIPAGQRYGTNLIVLQMNWTS